MIFVAPCFKACDIDFLLGLANGTVPFGGQIAELVNAPGSAKFTTMVFLVLTSQLWSKAAQL